MILLYLVALALTIATSLASSLAIAKIEALRGFLCRDVHKPFEVRIPCCVGPAITIALVVGLLASYAFGLLSGGRALAISLSVSIATLVGLVDDLRGLSARAKIALGMLPALPVLAMHQYVPRPWIPLVGHARMFIVYPLLVLIAYTVFCNGANMIDTHNGLLVGGALSVIATSLALSLALGAPLSYVVTLSIALCALAPYAVLNAYPARVFNGNAGSFAIGAILASCAITCRLEALFILANMVLFMNGWIYLASVRGFLQKEMVKRPTVIDPDGYMKPSCDRSAPITFARLALAILGKASEKEFVNAVIATYVVNCIVAAILLVALGFGFR